MFGLKKSQKYLLGLGLLLSLSACSEANIIGVSESTPAMAPNPSPDGLASLITGSVTNTEEIQLRDTLERKIVLAFPIRVGILHYNYQTELTPTDRQELFQASQKFLAKSDLVRDVIQIPQALVPSGASVDQIRQLAARFQADVVIIVSGQPRFERSEDQPLSFFDSFTDKTFYDSSLKLEAITLDVFTGTFLSPFSSAIQKPGILLDPSAEDYPKTSYALKKETESEAWEALDKEFLKRLEDLKIEIESRPTATEENEEKTTESGGEE